MVFVEAKKVTTEKALETLPLKRDFTKVVKCLKCCFNVQKMLFFSQTQVFTGWEKHES